MVTNIRNFFSTYINDDNFITYVVHGVTTKYYTIDVRLYYLKGDFIKQYTFSELQKYILEILIQLLKYNFDLDSIAVRFYDTIISNTPLYYALSDFAERQLIKT